MMQPSVSFSIGACYFRNCSFVQWTFSAPRSQVSQILFLLLLATSSRLFLQHSRNLGTAYQLSPELHTLFRTCWGFRDHKAYGSWLSAFRSWSVLRWVDFACWPHLSASAGPTPICHTCEGRGKNIAPKFLLYRTRLC